MGGVPLESFSDVTITHGQLALEGGPKTRTNTGTLTGGQTRAPHPLHIRHGHPERSERSCATRSDSSLRSE
ncbi:MAG: hypothetical protein C0183_06955 [Roseiflexus castenholzii]|nr:MAG: hypothetical protein C0183_06955 [Roseiflexus castenholzii]